MRGVGSGGDLDAAANVAVGVPYEVRDLLALSYDLSHALVLVEYLKIEMTAAPQFFVNLQLDVAWNCRGLRRVTIAKVKQTPTSCWSQVHDRQYTRH